MLVDINKSIDAFGGLEPIDGDRFTPMSEDELEAIEAELGSRLPDSYRYFLVTYGACSPREIVMYDPVIGLPSEVSTSGRGNIANFYGTRSDVDDAYSLQRRMLFFSGRIPANLIPIADNGGGSQILLGTSGNEAGKVYLWDLHNEPLDEEDYGVPRPPEAMFENVHLIAKSFEGLLRRLEVKAD
jgi:hypothetical protein